MDIQSIPNTARTYYVPPHFIDKKLKVVIAGLGGTGSAMISELMQLNGILCGLGFKGLHVTAYDGDLVSESNVYRQNFWPYDIGRNKADVLISRINQFTGLNWDAVPDYLTTEELLDQNFDLLITAVDKAAVRYEFGKALNKSLTKALWLDLGNGNHQANVLLGSASKHNPDKNRLPSPFELYGSQWAEIATSEIDSSSCSTEEAIQRQTFGINGMTARSATSMLLFPLMRSGKLNHHGLFIDLHEAEITKLKVDPLQWSVYGYTEHNVQ